MIKRQLTIAGIGLGGFIILFVLYALVLSPMLEKLFAEELVDVVLLQGESIYGMEAETYSDDPNPRTVSVPTDYRIMITEKVERSNMLEVEVYNSYGTYKVVHELESNSFYVEGSELTPIDIEQLASFATETGYMLSMMRVAAEGVDEEGDELLSNLSQYGLAPEDDPYWFRVTDIYGKTFRIFIGDRITTGAGYYVMYEGRNAVYIVNNNLEQNVLNEKYTLMQPIITTPIAQNELLYIDNYKFFRKGEQLVGISQGEVPEGSTALIKLEMVYPAPYKIESTNYNNVLYYFTGFVGEKVVTTDITEETLEQYGIMNYYCRVYFEYDGGIYSVYFSEKDADGYCYVLSEHFGSIVLLDASEMDFLDWELIKYVDKPVFMQNINDVSSIVINDGTREDVFILEGTDSALMVTGNGKTIDTAKFRQYYMSILYIELQESGTPEEGEELPSIVTMTLTMRDGEVYRYDFYFWTTRRSFYTINGHGDFYILRDKALKLIADTAIILAGGDVVADAPE